MKQRWLKLGLWGILTVALGWFLYYRFPQIWGEVFYPLDYREDILQASEEFKIPRNFIVAVIFNESHFNPNAKSGVGASGLMQLMPGTARGVAARIGITDYTDAQIFEPALNIRLGSAYLASYYELYNQNIDAVLTAYNAGPAVSGRFIQDTSNRNILPRETSNFIRRVKSTWLAYDRIYGVNWEGGFSLPEEKSFVEKIDIFNLLDLLKK